VEGEEEGRAFCIFHISSFFLFFLCFSTRYVFSRPPSSQKQAWIKVHVRPIHNNEPVRCTSSPEHNAVPRSISCERNNTILIDVAINRPAFRVMPENAPKNSTPMMFNVKIRSKIHNTSRISTQVTTKFRHQVLAHTPPIACNIPKTLPQRINQAIITLTQLSLAWVAVSTTVQNTIDG
jgi:hypothetical protein